MHRVTCSYGTLYFTPDVIVRRGHRQAHLREVSAICVHRSAKLNPAFRHAGPEPYAPHVPRKTYFLIPRPVTLGHVP